MVTVDSACMFKAEVTGCTSESHLRCERNRELKALRPDQVEGQGCHLLRHKDSVPRLGQEFRTSA